jgi:hypothetical protein
MRVFGAGIVLALAVASPAWADDDEGTLAEIRALRREAEAQGRCLRELEGSSPTSVDVAAAVDRYLSTEGPFLLAGGDEAKGGKAGWPKGKKPFLSEGPNKLEIGLRHQFRYEAFLYSDDARASAANDDRPQDRSGFELETLILDLQGSFLCPELTFRMMLNFDSDAAAGVEKRWAWLDYRYASSECAEHHLRAGQQKVVFGFEDYASATSLIFVDRNLVAKAFGLNYDTGINLWGTFGDACEPKRFRYAFEMLNGEGRADLVGSVFADATDRTSDQLLYAAMFEWNVTDKDWAWDEVDNRCGDERCRLDLSLGVSAHYEDDDDATLLSGVPGSLAVKSTGPLTRWGANAWLRAQWRGWSLQSEVYHREVDFTAGSSAKDQVDDGFYVQAHHRFEGSPWGAGAKFAMIWADEDGFADPLEDTFWEAGLALNYFVWDHSHKVTVDASRVSGNSGVSSTGPGYGVSAAKGVIVEDGWLLRVQWQVNF